ncbi:tumor necrosis factor ligand superfamily member 10 isoform X2 [Salmo trutta]|uniref:Tumor necrosis factor ligand superfamily member 10 n=1 Tax=Salmo trutta TaxID=8032 RepID=A0A674B313_SALTR|nr:tumor necrosis factor ligand superfamily member 10-like isoform X2 [Salmo trutta]
MITAYQCWFSFSQNRNLLHDSSYVFVLHRGLACSSLSLSFCAGGRGAEVIVTLSSAFVLKPERSRAGREAVVGMAGGSSGFTFLGVLLLAAILLQTVAVTVTVLYFTNVLNTMKETFARSSVSCLTRSDLRGGYVRSPTEGRGDPCWQVTQQLHTLIEKSLFQRYQREISSAVRDEMSGVLPSLAMEDQASSRPKVAAHVTGSFAPKAAREGGASPGRRVQGQKISWWEGHKGLAFLQDVRLIDGELVVPCPGLYYIYAQTYFRHTHPGGEEGEEEEREQRGRPMLQYVYKKVSSYPVPILLMKTSRTSCWSRDSQFSLHSAHQGGLFPLATGDRLLVTVSNASAIDMDERSSFFGAVLVS